MKLRATSAADVDVVDAAEWLERQKAGLGDDFLDDLDASFAEIRRAPLGCPTLHFPRVTFKFDLRWLAVGRFSYLTIFHIIGDEIVIVPVLSTHRDLESNLRSRVGTF